MERSTKQRVNKKGTAAMQPAPLEELESTPVGVIESFCDDIVDAEDAPIVLSHRRSPKKCGRPSDEERGDADVQMREMQSLAGHLLFHFRTAVKNKELDFNQELQLFKVISPFLGYSKVGNKVSADIGMDAFAMKYLEINTRLK